MVMVKNSASPVPYLTTSSVAPAPCSALARPCLDVWRGEPLLVQRIARFAGPHAALAPIGAARRTGEYGMVFSATSGFGVGWVGQSYGYALLVMVMVMFIFSALGLLWLWL